MNLKQLRTEKGISVPQLSEISGVPRRTIQDIEKNGVCKTTTAIQLAHALAVTLDQLTGYQPYQGPYREVDWREIKLYLQAYLPPNDFQILLENDRTHHGLVHINTMNQAYTLYEKLKNGEITKEECRWIPVLPSY